MRSECFNTQPPEGGWLYGRDGAVRLILVSTHSRPKAAGYIAQQEFVEFSSFNTQPPEGGWLIKKVVQAEEKQFQHTAARRRLDRYHIITMTFGAVSTHSRPKAAGFGFYGRGKPRQVSTHSRPKAAGGVLYGQVYIGGQFQHTAARRRLDSTS